MSDSDKEEDADILEAEAQLAADPFLAEQIERVMAPHRARLAPDAFRVFRSVLVYAYTEDPVFVQMVRALRPRMAPIKSDAEPVDGASRDEEAIEKKPAGGSK